jgi:hypothetical protein
VTDLSRPTTNLRASLLANNQNTVIEHEFLRRNTHKFLAGFAVLMYAFDAFSVLTNNDKPLGGGIQIAGDVIGLAVASLIMAAPERKNDLQEHVSCNYTLDVLKRMVTIPLSCFQNADPRRFLASTNIAVRAFIYIGHGIAEKEMSPLVGGLFAIAVLCNSALAFPKKNETGYILYGALMLPTSLGLLIANALNGTTPAVMLAYANAANISASIFAVAVSGFAHREAVKKAEGYSKVGAFLKGDAAVISV